MRKILTLLFLVIVTSCTVRKPVQTYFDEPNISLLTKGQVLGRWRYTNRGCLEEAKSPQRVRDCGTRFSRDKKALLARIAEVHPEWPKELLSALKLGFPLAVGMTQEQLITLMDEPHDKNLTVTKWGMSAQYVYENPTIYVYVENGVVTGYQL